MNLQALLCSDFVTWTALIETALSSGQGPDEIPKLRTQNEEYVSKLSKLVLQETDKEKTRVYANLILSQGDCLTFAPMLLDFKVGNSNDFRLHPPCSRRVGGK